MRQLAFLPPANEVCEGYVFTPVCQSFCSQGGMRGCVGGMRGCWGEGVHGCGGPCVVARGACMVAGGSCVVVGGACVGYDEIRSMSGWYASYWNVFLFRTLILTTVMFKSQEGLISIPKKVKLYSK